MDADAMADRHDDARRGGANNTVRLRGEG